MNNLIVHIADIHIRNTIRHREYREVFKKFIATLGQLKPMAVVVVGDLFHNKLMLSPEAFIMAKKLIKDITDITDLIIVPGNHDVNINNKDRYDGIYAVIEEMNNPKIHYYRKNGIFKFMNTNINLGIFSLVDDINPAPIKFKKEEGQIYIALYHGTIDGSCNDDGFVFNSNNSSSLFENYDYVFLGDIHKRQFLNKEKTIAYPGSLIQQDFGEAISKGALVWDLDNKLCEFMPIKNEYSFVNLYSNDVENLSKVKFSEKVHVRFLSNKDLDDISKENIEKTIRNYLSKNKIELLNYSYDYVAEHTEIQVDAQVENINDVNVQNTIMRDYLKKQGIKEDCIDKCIELNKETNDKITKNDMLVSEWYPEELRFSNFFGFGENNELLIKNYKGVTGIFGANESGKTSVFETLFFAIYGDTFRGTTVEKLINFSKNNASCEVILNSSGTRYQINRSITLKDSGKIETTVEIKNISQLDDITLPTGKNEIKAWLKNKLGTPQDFIETSLSNQFNIQKIIMAGSTERGQLLIRFIGLNIFKDLIKAFKPEWDLLNHQIKSFKKDEVLKSFSELQLKIAQETEVLKDKNIEQLEKKKELKTFEKEKMIYESQIVKTEFENISIDDVNANLIDKQKMLQNNLLQINDIQSKIIETLEYNEEEEKTYQGKLKLIQDKITLENKELHQLENKIANLNKSIVNAKKSSAIIDNQPWCREDTNCQKCTFLSNAFEEEKEILSLSQEVIQLEKDQEAKEQIIDKFTLKRKNFEYEIEELKKNKEKLNENNLNKSKLDTLKLNNKNLEYEIEALNITLKKIKDQSAILENNKILEEKIEVLEDKIEDINSENEQLIHEVNNLKVSLRIAGEKLLEINKKIDELNKIEEEYIVAEVYYNMIHRDGLPLTILKKYINEINAKINNIIHNIVNWSAYLKVEGENIDIVIQKMDGFTSLANENGSGMQTNLVGLAIRAALVLVSRIAKCKILFFDEPLTAFDDEKKRDVSKVFNYLRTMFPAIFIISHIEVHDICNNIIQIEKEIGGFAKLSKS